MMLPPMTMAERAESYAATFPGRPPLQLVREQGRDVVYGTWLGGADYRATSAIYGGFPPGFLDRVFALFPDVVTVTANVGPARDWPVLHAFSGGIPEGPHVRLDIREEPVPGVRPELVGSVYDAGALVARGPFSLVVADPPYSAVDAKRYATKMVDRRRAVAALARVVHPGGHLVWLDCCWPIHSKREWVTVGRIALVRSTNHRLRMVSIFERVRG